MTFAQRERCIAAYKNPTVVSHQQHILKESACPREFFLDIMYVNRLLQILRAESAQFGNLTLFLRKGFETVRKTELSGRKGEC